MQTTIVRAFNNAGGKKISRDLKALYIHRVLLRIAFGIATVFTVALIYQYFDKSFLAVAIVYGAIHALVFFLTPLSSKWLRSLGIRSMILVAVPTVTLGTIGLYNFSKGGENALYGLGAFVVLMAAYKIMYWVPYQVDVSLLLDRKHRGRQVALLRNASDLVIVTTPFFGGLLISSFGFSTLYLIAIAITALAAIPIFFLKTSYESYQWGYFETIQELFKSRNRNLVFAYIGDGIQSITLSVVWPLFVFILLKEKYAALGLITALTLLVILVLRLVTGSLFDKWNKSKLIIIGAALASSGWLLKILVATPFQVFAADTYHGMGRTVNRTSVDAMTYERSAERESDGEEHTTLKEMSLAAGRVSMLALTALIVLIYGLNTAFIAALVISAGATLATILLKERVKLK
jgi:hypothetical protein